MHRITRYTIFLELLQYDACKCTACVYSRVPYSAIHDNGSFLATHAMHRITRYTIFLELLQYDACKCTACVYSRVPYSAIHDNGSFLATHAIVSHVIPFSWSCYSTMHANAPHVCTVGYRTVRSTTMDHFWRHMPSYHTLYHFLGVATVRCMQMHRMCVQ